MVRPPRGTRKDGGDARLGGLSRVFFEQSPPSKVLVDFGDGSAAASMEGNGRRTDLRKRISDLLGDELKPVFDQQFQSSGMVAPAFGPQPDAAMLSRFAEVAAESPQAAREKAERLRKQLKNEVAEILPVPPAVPALGPGAAEPASVHVSTPGMIPLQGYLAPGPHGVGALFAWQFPGGDGAGVTVIDMEGGWRLEHEKLAPARFNMWSGAASTADAWLDHGTAVAGMLGALPDGVGTTGICPGARLGLASVFETTGSVEQRVANQVNRAGQLLRAGDVLLLELQRPGPRTDFEPDDDQKGYVPVTYWPDVRAVVQSLVARGVCVIAVGANGGENLDDPIYEKRFDLARECGAVHVGAGAPPGGMYGPARSRLGFSNYGSVMDVQGWGQLVTTCGYGDLWGSEDNPNHSYTSRFMGTSSAAPMIAGLVACIQGRHKAVYGVPMAPAAVRAALRTFGWLPETTNTGEQRLPHIGLQPDLRQLFPLLGLA